MINEIIHGDCLKVMPKIDAGSVDMILCDLPYGTTPNDWDSIIPLVPLWAEYKRIIKPNGAIVLTAQTPFDKILGASNLQMLRYEWILEKEHPTGFLNANKMPLKAHENALVFYKNLPTYRPIKTKGHKPVNKFTKHTSDGSNYGKTKQGITGGGNTDRYPRSVLKFKYDTQQEAFHPTQKPVEMMRYFIETYTNEGETVLDNCMGSGTTAVAALSCGRNFIGIEKEMKYVEIARKRLQSVQAVMNL